MNPEKCVFCVLAGLRLNFRFFHARDREKIQPIERMSRTTNLNGIQKISRYLASLSRFISHVREKALPLYHMLKKAGYLF